MMRGSVRDTLLSFMKHFKALSSSFMSVSHFAESGKAKNKPRSKMLSREIFFIVVCLIV